MTRQKDDVESGAKPGYSLLRMDSTDSAAYTRPALAVFVFIIVLFIAARLWHLTASCLWFDEIFSVHAARHTWKGMIAFVAKDIIHPPLFYLLLKAWIGIGGESLLWLRLFPVLTAIAAIVPFVLLCRELKLRATEINLALLLMAVNGYLVRYSQTLRMYSLLLFLTLCSLWLFARFFNSRHGTKGSLIALFVANLLLVYTHYYGWLVVGVELTFLLFWKRDKLVSFLISVAVLILCFSPWAYAVVREAVGGKGTSQNLGWAARPNLSSLTEHYSMLSGLINFRRNTPVGAPWGALLFGCPILLWAWHILRRDRSDGQVATFWWLFLPSFLPTFMAFVISQFFRQSVWGVRRLIIVAAPYLLLVSFAACRLRPFCLRTTILLLIGCWTFLAGFVLLIRNDGNYIWCAWDTLARRMMQAEAPQATGIKVYAFEDLVAYHLWFSLDSAHEKRFRVVVIKGIPGLVEDPAYFLPRGFPDVAVKDINALSGDHFWVAFRDVSWNQERPPIKILMDNGYQVGESFSLNTSGYTAFMVPVWRR